jgi:hypothetical protein
MPRPIQPPPVPVDPRTALLLNLILLGVGYFYIRQWQKGLLQLLVGFFLAVLTAAYGTWALIIALLIVAVSTWDVSLQAAHLATGHPISQWTFFNKHLGEHRSNNE